MPNQRELPLDLDNAKKSIAKMAEDDVRQIVVQANQWADYQEFTGLMNSIADEMRLNGNPDAMPSGKDDTNALLKVEFPKKGGVLTYMESYVHPFRGYPHHEFVDKIDVIKKINRGLLSGLFHQFKTVPKWKFVTLLPALWSLKLVVRSWITMFHRMVERFLIKPERYSQPIAEIHRAFSLSQPRELTKDAEIREKFRDILCMILEFDNAYRFRAQDIVVELDKQALQQNPNREIVRLLALMSSRETTPEIRDTWTLLQNVVRFYLRFDSKFTAMLRHALLALEAKEIELTTGDKEYCIPRKDYSFGFKTNPTLEDAQLIHLYELKENHKNHVKAIRKESNEEHQKLLAHYRQNPQDESRKKEEMRKLDEKYEALVAKAVEAYQREKSLVI